MPGAVGPAGKTAALGYKRQRIAPAVIVLKLVALETAGSRSLRQCHARDQARMRLLLRREGGTLARRWPKRMGVQTNAEDPRIVYQVPLLRVLPTVALSVWRRSLHVRITARARSPRHDDSGGEIIRC